MKLLELPFYSSFVADKNSKNFVIVKKKLGLPQVLIQHDKHKIFSVDNVIHILVRFPLVKLTPVLNDLVVYGSTLGHRQTFLCTFNHSSRLE